MRSKQKTISQQVHELNNSIKNLQSFHFICPRARLEPDSLTSIITIDDITVLIGSRATKLCTDKECTSHAYAKETWLG